MKNSVNLLILATVIAVAFGLPQKNRGGNRLIQLNEEEPAQWLSEEQIQTNLINHKVNFMDITDHPTPKKVQKDSVVKNVLPREIQYGEAVTAAIAKLSIPRMEEFITTFSAYNNRYYTADTGVESAEWLSAHVLEILVESNYDGAAGVTAYRHDWPQESVIARIEGADPALSAEVVILGAHLDSVSSGATGRAPGADDNGSGSVVLLETYIALLETGFIPKRSIEFHWYAAEEVGLRGSQDIANEYADQNVQVVAFMNFDVVGWFNGEKVVGLVSDYTDDDLTAFLRTLVDEYLVYGHGVYTCGYACSDHASWDRAGYPAAYPSEIEDNPYMHTPSDTIERVNFEQVQEFAKLAVGYAIELAEPCLQAECDYGTLPPIL